MNLTISPVSFSYHNDFNWLRRRKGSRSDLHIKKLTWCYQPTENHCIEHLHVPLYIATTRVHITRAYEILWLAAHWYRNHILTHMTHIRANYICTAIRNTHKTKKNFDFLPLLLLLQPQLLHVFAFARPFDVWIDHHDCFCPTHTHICPLPIHHLLVNIFPP